MSLVRLKTLYCIATMAISILLAFFGGWIGWLAAVLILASALPAWRMVIKAAGDTGAREALTVIQYQLRRRSKSDDEDAPASQDRQAVRR